MGPETTGEFLDLFNARVPAFSNDVSCSEVAGLRLPVRVPRHGDDPFGSKLLGRQDPEEAHGAVPDDGDSLVRSNLGGDSREPARSQHIRGRQQGRDQVGVGHFWGRYEGAVGVRDAGKFGLRADGAHGLDVDAAGLVTGPAVSQVLSDAMKEPTTKSPGLTVLTSGPTSSNPPTHSRPMGAFAASSAPR